MLGKGNHLIIKLKNMNSMTLEVPGLLGISRAITRDGQVIDIQDYEGGLVYFVVNDHERQYEVRIQLKDNGTYKTISDVVSHMSKLKSNSIAKNFGRLLILAEA